MPCDIWTEKLDAYVDGELSSAEDRAFAEHVRECPSCAAESLSRVQQKRAIQAAGIRYAPDPAFRARVQKSIASRGLASHRARKYWLWFPALAAVAVIAVAAVSLSISRQRSHEHELLSELADLHVATLASSNPVDVVSTDRHTVKPWFEGKIPFTFNLPELKDTPFTLIGGRVSYLNQSPGAELIFRVRQHQISVFIFQDRSLGATRADNSMQSALSFNVRSWRQNGLDYFAISDVNAQDLDKLCDLLKSAS